MATNKELLAEKDLALMKAIREKTEEGKFIWSFQNNQAIGQAANMVVILSMPSSEFLQNSRWRSIHVAIAGTVITNFFYPNDQLGINQGARFAAPDVTPIVDGIFGHVIKTYEQQTYGKALNLLEKL